MMLYGGRLGKYAYAVEKLASKHIKNIQPIAGEIKIGKTLETYYSYGIGEGISSRSGSILVIHGDVNVVDEWVLEDWPYLLKYVRLKGSEGIVLRYIVNDGEVSLNERYVCRDGIWYLVL